MRPRLTFIIGCTACGKGAVGRMLAQKAGGELISVDSAKVYRGMDIGTAKPSPELRNQVRHHLIDVADPSETFSVARFIELADRAIEGATKRGRPIFVVGGTPLYIKALCEGLFDGPGADPSIRARLHATAMRDGTSALHEQLRRVDAPAAERIHPNDLRRVVRALEVFELTGRPITTLQSQWDRRRTRYDCTFVGLQRDREDQSKRINDRVRRMFAEGFVDEVRGLLDRPIPLSGAARNALGYAEIIGYLEGRYGLADAAEMIKIKTRHFAKAQRTWFKRFERTEWISLALDSDMLKIADDLMARRATPWSPQPK